MLAMFECTDFLRWNCPKTIKDTGSYEPVSFMVFGQFHRKKSVHSNMASINFYNSFKIKKYDIYVY